MSGRRFLFFTRNTTTTDIQQMTDTTDEEAEDALAPGGRVDVFAFSNIGFVLQYFVVGLIYGGLPASHR